MLIFNSYFDITRGYPIQSLHPHEKTRIFAEFASACERIFKAFNLASPSNLGTGALVIHPVGGILWGYKIHYPLVN